jgi:hypothetical protein
LAILSLPGYARNNSQQAIDDFLAGRFNWKVSEPLVAPLQRAGDTFYSIKDPTIVRYDGRWHLFCTIRAKNRSHQIEYLAFENWENIDKAERCLLTISQQYYCAPQVFYFEPHKKWYLIYQTSDKSRKPALQPAYSTTDDITKPASWSRPTLLFSQHPDNVKKWIDFWVICDDTTAHLFFTSLDGKMWRAETKLEDFPAGWSQPNVVLEADIFEAGHTYYVKNIGKFLTVIEAEDFRTVIKAGDRPRRYYKAYIADTLDGKWKPLADTKQKPFASPVNCSDSDTHWTDSFSHGELIRDGYNQKLEVDSAKIKFLFQGVRDEVQQGKIYGQISWRLGILYPSTSKTEKAGSKTTY